jgi:hypothetical protein
MRNKILIGAALGLAMTASVHAQSKLPDAPVPHFDRKEFILESSALTLANVLDGISTARDTRMGFSEAQFPRGSAALLGTHPGAARYACVMGLEQGIAEFSAYRMEHSRYKLLRATGHALLIEGISVHIEGAANNLYLQHSKR